MSSHSRSVSFARRRCRCMADSAVARASEPGSTRVWHDPHLLLWMATIASFGASEATRSVGDSGSGRGARDVVIGAGGSPTELREAQPAANTTNEATTEANERAEGSIETK